MKMLVKEIAAACGGRILCGDADAVVTSVSTDSRKIEPGALFVPVKGERVNAHDFIPAVFQSGAVATLTQEHQEMADNHAWIFVTDTGEALQKIAAAYRRRFSIPIVGITGSVGKTTTKEMIALALSAGLKIMKTEGNFNSQIGLPLTMFRLSQEHQVAVIEMGMSNFGEMGRLAQIARPDCAVITNIGLSHIEQLKTQQNIRSEKLHITDCFAEGSVLFLNGDDPLLAELKGNGSFPVVFFGTKDWCDYWAEDIVPQNGGTAFVLRHGGTRRSAFIPVPGIHNVSNALAAIAVADHLGVDSEAAVRCLKEYCPPAMRQQVHQMKGITVLDDSYNASPDSMRSSINVLMGFNQPGKRVAVLADMLELGEISEKAHFDTGTYAAKAGVTNLVTVGERAKSIAKGVRSVNPGITQYSCLNNEEALFYLKQLLRPGDAVLVKGSRGMHTDEIVKGLLKP